MSPKFRRLTSLVAGLALIAGCSSELTAPPQQVAPAVKADAALLGIDGGLVTGLIPVLGVQRVTALPADITVSQTIGMSGGTLGIPAAGVSVVVPYGAVTSNTVITMTARKGTLIAYDFAPHGITFKKQLVFTQKLQGTTASVLTAPLLSLGYYSDPSLLTAVGGSVSELIGGVTNLVAWTFTGKINHFSGYMVAMGRDSALSAEE